METNDLKEMNCFDLEKLKGFLTAGIVDGVFIEIENGGFKKTSYENGRVVMIDECDSSEKNGKKTFFDGDEKVEKKSEYKNGQLNGISERFYKTGDLCKISEYRDGELNGRSFSFNPKGKIVKDFNFKDDVEYGICDTYSNDGSKLIERSFMNEFRKKRLEYHEDGSVSYCSEITKRDCKAFNNIRDINTAKQRVMFFDRKIVSRVVTWSENCHTSFYVELFDENCKKLLSLEGFYTIQEFELLYFTSYISDEPEFFDCNEELESADCTCDWEVVTSCECGCIIPYINFMNKNFKSILDLCFDKLGTDAFEESNVLEYIS